ncbi:RIP metalloprotease RseP [Rhizorhapis suberifaciens]|uniref:Zinc metalloprotease n=1 Tax=Rhizorhapis suberifaciens TaxID=13656 RepID=A0A840HSI3_9SPHN|nr:RIP metalloprotease RseP [Rhizorhapis suberifaciens]MBB4640528.1 regulator of sigma E protease [Rhizorhapis suberifaciens]
MTESPGFLLTIVAFIAVIGPLVFVHEMGHYLVGRLFGVKAETFSIGVGKELAHWTDKRGTRWRLAALPLGGYVKFKGDMDGSSQPDARWLELPPHERAECFPGKPLWQRALIVVAGPAINFLFAIVVLAGFAMIYGQNVTPPIVNSLIEGSAAQKAGLRSGDRIVAIDGHEIDRFDQVAQSVFYRPDEVAHFAIERNGEVELMPVRIGVRKEVDRFGNEYRIGLIGIQSPQSELRQVSPLEAPAIAVERTGAIVRLMVNTIGQIISGRRSLEELGGPLKIAQISGEQAGRGFEDFIFFMALISINLAFINLLPIPMLDGGHLLFYGIEAIQRKPVSPVVQEWAFRSGLALLLTVMLFVTFNDLSSFGVWKGLSGLIG